MAIEAAAVRWERIITQNVPYHRLSDHWRRWLARLYPETTIPNAVDDLLVFVDIREMDGPKGSIGQARRLFWRDPSFLPVAAGIMLDKDDVNRISDDRVEAIVLHEMGHAVGFWTGTWRPNNLLQNPSLHENGDSIVPTPDTDFSGTNAIAAFNAAGGSSYTGPRSRSRTPLGDRATGTFTGGSPCSKNELMTSRLGDAVSFPLSAVTIQSHMLQRRRYPGRRLHPAQTSSSDPLARSSVGDPEGLALLRTSSSGPLERSSNEDREGLALLNCVETHPEAGPDEPEPITLNLRRAGERE